MDAIEIKNRCVGAILGFAIGDAIGMPAEFLSREEIKRCYGKPISTFIRAHPGHANDFLSPGSYTDATQVMLTTAECLIECRKMDPARYADALLSWHKNNAPHRSPSKAVMTACKHLENGKPWNKSGVFSGGCSAATRMIPIGLFFNASTDELTRAALDNCIITHTEPRARAASVAVAYLAARLMQSDERSWPPDQVLETADHIECIDRSFASVLRWSTQITHLPPEEALFEIGVSSDAIEAVPAAIYCFLKHPQNFLNAVLSAANAGDAANSIAALAGSFVGALAGMQAIDKSLANDIENSDVLVGIGENIAKTASQKTSSFVNK
jgi:ADP-ribosyl-[dinitrogen reductase] hydrolase